MSKIERERGENPIDHLVPYQQYWHHSCGPASIKMMLECYGIHFRESEIVKSLEVTPDGIDWRDVLDFLRNLTELSVFLFAHGEYYDLRMHFNEHKSPIMIAWNPSMKKKGDHFSVIKHINIETIKIADPNGGVIVTLPRDEFLNRWEGAGIYRPYLVIDPQKKK